LSDPERADNLVQLTRRTLDRAREHAILQWGAALAFYAAVSLAPLLMILVSSVGPLVGSGAFQQEIERHAAELLGPGGREIVRTILAGVQDRSDLPQGIALIALIGGATLFFAQLQNALNHVWGARPRRHIWRLLRRRAKALGLTAILAGLLAASIFASDLAGTLNRLLAQSTVGSSTAATVRQLVSLSWLSSIVLFALLIGVLYRTLPDVRVGWRDLGVGVGLTTILFVLGRWVSGIYLLRAGASSLYGAAGSLIVLLFWLYYSAVSALFAAEFTAVWAEAQGRPLIARRRKSRSPDDRDS